MRVFFLCVCVCVCSFESPLRAKVSGQEAVPWSELQPTLLAEKAEGGSASVAADATGKQYKRLLDRKKEGVCVCVCVCVLRDCVVWCSHTLFFYLHTNRQATLPPPSPQHPRHPHENTHTHTKKKKLGRELRRADREHV